MKKFLSTLLIFSSLIVSQLGFVEVYNETNIWENNIIEEKQVNIQKVLKKTLSLIPIHFSFNKNKSNTTNYNITYIWYFAPQNTYYLLTWIIKNIN